jgi:hypothetical protein
MRQEPYKQIEHREHLINIYREENPDSPREWSNLGTMYTSHRNYQPEKRFHDHFETDEVFKSEWVFSDRFLREYIALPVYLYDHSWQTVSTRPFFCQWDSGLFGIIAVPIEDVKKEYGWKILTKKRRTRIEQRLQSEVATYDDYLTGEVYRFDITPADDADAVIESYGGFYGEGGLEQIEAECKAEIDAIHHREAVQRVVNVWKYAVQLCLPFPEYQLSTI